MPRKKRFPGWNRRPVSGELPRSMIIPFFIPHAGCTHQCVFCNQKRITGAALSLDISLISRTIELYLASNLSGTPAQVAFYGGSFTALPLEEQRSCLGAVLPFIRSGAVSGVRLSTRPDCISPEILDLLKDHHVHTVELGVQSMDDRVLALSGRGHTADRTRNAVRLLRRYPFTIGLQLMPGLPGDSPENFGDTVLHVVALRPDFVRIYPALVIRDTPLETLFRAGRYSPLALDDAVTICRKALLTFLESGIDVIRIGLQPSEELERAGTVIAGPYHPAFRQLVESSIMLDNMRKELASERPGQGSTIVLVNPHDLSYAIGQKRSNLKALREELGLTVLVKADPTVPLRTVRAVPHEERIVD